MLLALILGRVDHIKQLTGELISFLERELSKNANLTDQFMKLNKVFLNSYVFDSHYFLSQSILCLDNLPVSSPTNQAF